MRTRCECRSAGDLCGHCDAQASRAQENAIFADVETDDWLADAAAAREYGGREAS